MQTLVSLIVLVGIGALSWVGFQKLQEKAKERTESPPRGRSMEQVKSDQVGGTGFWSRSSGVRQSSSQNSKNNTNVVRHKEKPYWKRRGWKKSNGNLTGYYRTKYGSFKGKIKDYRTKPEVLIYNPPKQLNNHDHSNCFFSKGGGKFKVHFKQKIDKPSIAIQSVEKILRESFQNS